MRKLTTMILFFLTLGIVNAQEPNTLVITKTNASVTKIALADIDNIAYEYGASPIFDASGNAYTEVVIGTQTWLVENLRTTKFNDGTDIPMATDAADFLTKGAAGAVFSWSGFDANNASPRGAYYNLTTINDAKGICPDGYRIPDNTTDYTTLVSYLGGAAVAGAKLKSDTNWLTTPAGTNESGFHGVGAGIVLPDNGLVNYEGNAYFWTSTENGGPTDHIFFVIPNEGSTGISGGGSNLHGLPCRCIKE